MTEATKTNGHPHQPPPVPAPRPDLTTYTLLVEEQCDGLTEVREPTVEDVGAWLEARGLRVVPQVPRDVLVPAARAAGDPLTFEIRAADAPQLGDIVPRTDGKQLGVIGSAPMLPDDIVFREAQGSGVFGVDGKVGEAVEYVFGTGPHEFTNATLNFGTIVRSAADQPQRSDIVPRLADDIQFGAAPTVVTTPEQARKKDEYGRAWPAELPPGSRSNIWNERENREVDTDVSGWKLTWDMAGRKALYQSGPPPEPYVFAEHVVFPDITSAKLAPSRAVAVLPRETSIDEDEYEHECPDTEPPTEAKFCGFCGKETDHTALDHVAKPGKLPSERIAELRECVFVATSADEQQNWLRAVGAYLDERLGRG